MTARIANTAAEIETKFTFKSAIHFGHERMGLNIIPYHGASDREPVEPSYAHSYPEGICKSLTQTSCSDLSSRGFGGVIHVAQVVCASSCCFSPDRFLNPVGKLQRLT